MKNHTQAIIDKHRKTTGFTKDVIESWGVDYPPPQGWMTALIENDGLNPNTPLWCPVCDRNVKRFDLADHMLKIHDIDKE